MKSKSAGHLCAALGLMLALALQSGDVGAADRTQVVKFGAGASGTTLSGALSGYDGVNYVLGARSGQSMSVTLSPDNSSCYFNVTAPGADSAMFIGSDRGKKFSASLPADGNYRILVYLMRNAARRAVGAQLARPATASAARS